MDLHARYRLTKVINARGTFTPLGVSRSTPQVGEAVAAALGEFFVIDELQDRASAALARWSGAEAGTVVHCAAAAITVSVAATMTGTSAEKIAALPDATGLSSRVVIPAGHVVDYGQSILQAIRLAGAAPVVADGDIDAALAHPETASLLLVSSRLVRGPALDLAETVRAAHRRGVPVIIDAAAQDLRVRDVVATGADLVLLSGQKYLASPTAGLVVGRAALLAAVRAQEKGIGRAMKASKEAIAGVLAALEAREGMDLAAWQAVQRGKVSAFVERVSRLPGLRAAVVDDPTGLPLARAQVTVAPARARLDAAGLASRLQAGDPPIWAMAHDTARGNLVFELVPLSDAEIEMIVVRLQQAIA